MSNLDKKYTIKLDTKNSYFNTVPTFSLSDNETSDFNIMITNRNSTMNLENVIVVMVAINPNGEMYSDFIEVENEEEGLLYCNLKQSFKNITGTWNARLMLIYEDEKVVTGTFSYRVNTDEFVTLNEKVVTDDRFPLLNDALSRLSSVEITEEQRQINEAQRILQEEINKTNETNRIENELVREHQDADREKAEAVREEQEHNRAVQENKRVSVETNRIEAELARTVNEDMRISNENQRITNYNFMTKDEVRRKLDEEVRIANEKSRELEETSRVNEETRRRTVEQLRTLNEDTRIANETNRSQAESSRQINETNRIEAENNRKIEFQEKVSTFSTYENTINTLGIDFDNTVANVTNGNESATNTEIVLARKGETSLRKKMDKIDEQFISITKRGFVTYEQFGAILDGRDITDIAKQTHEFANKYGLTVKQNNGSYKLSDTITITSDVDLRGSNLIIDDYTPNKILYKIDSDDTFKTLSSFQNEYMEGVHHIESLSSYKNTFIKIESDEIFATRIDGVDYVKQESTVHISDGFLLAELIDNYTTGNITVKYKSILDKPITFMCPTLQFEKTDMSYVNEVISCERSNTTISDLMINSVDLPVLDNGIYKGALIYVKDCYNITLKDFTGQNLSANSLNNLQPCYIFTCDHVINLNLDNINVVRGWGCMATHYVKNMIVKNSVLNRIDSHVGNFNITIDNCSLISCYGIQIGWGKGVVSINSCKTLYDDYKAGGVSTRTCVLLRTDWGLLFEGTLKINNHYVRNYISSVKDLPIVSIYNITEMNYNQSRPVKLGSVIIDNVVIDNKADTNVKGLSIKVNNNMKLTDTGKFVIKNINTLNQSPTNFFTPFDYSSTDDLLSDLRIELENIITPIQEKYKTGFTDEDFTNMDNLNTKSKLVHIYTPIATNTVNLLVSSCEGNIYIQNKNKTVIRNSTISCLFIGNQKCERLIVDNTTLYPTTSLTSWSTILPCHNAIYRDNIINAIYRSEDSEYTGVNLENIANVVLMKDNYLIGKSSDTTVAQSLKETISSKFVQ